MKNITVLLIITVFLISSAGVYTGYFVLSGNEKTYLVSQVLDGDTVQLDDGEKVRLLGINTPEKSEYYYQQAKDRLKELVEGKKVRLESVSEDKDKYDRLLRYIFTDNTLVNLQLVKEGYATVYMIQPDEKYYLELKEAEDEAKDKQIGLWSTSTSINCITITNFHYNAKGDDNQNLNDEYVVFKNNCNLINMDSWVISDASNKMYTFKDFRLAGNSTFTLYSGSGSDTGDKLYWNSKKYAIWNNGGDTLYLRDNNGNLILSYSYPT